MTIAELIEALQAAPDHSAEVFYPHLGDGGGLNAVENVDLEPMHVRNTGYGNSYTGVHEVCDPDHPDATPGVYIS